MRKAIYASDLEDHMKNIFCEVAQGTVREFRVPRTVSGLVREYNEWDLVWGTTSYGKKGEKETEEEEEDDDCKDDWGTAPTT